MKSYVAVVLALLAIAGPVVKAQNATFPNIMAALTGANLTGLSQLVRLAGLDDDLSDPTLDVTLFAPNNAAIAAATQQLSSLAGANLTQLVTIILLYHVSPNVSINFTDGLIIPTFLGGQNITNTTTTLTALQLANSTYYLGSFIPGAVFNISSKIRAGKSDIYVINGVLTPPSAIFDVPLTVNAGLAASPDFSTLYSLIKADPAVFNATGDPNLAVTIFAPTNAAFAAFFRSAGVTLSQVAGTALARTVLLNHIFPDFPALASDIDLGVTRIQSAANSTLTLNKTRNGTSGFALTIRGTGNNASIPVLVFDEPVGMCAVHVIGGVLLPNVTSNATAAGK